MIARANTTVSILRGPAVANQFLDIEQSGTVIASGVPASIIEKTQKVTTSDQPTPMIIRIISCRLNGGTVILEDDQITDERSGITYAVDNFISSGSSAVHTADVHIELKRIS